MTTSQSAATEAGPPDQTTQYAEALFRAVPFTRTLGLEAASVSLDAAVLAMPDHPSLHNHIGGPHAGATFSLAESATGALMLANFAAMLDRFVPLLASAKIRYRAPAMGRLTASATLSRPASEVIADAEANGKARVECLVQIADTNGNLCAEMTADWALVPLKK